MQFKSFMEALKGKQHKIDKNKNGEIDAHDFKLLRKEEEELGESEERMARADYKVGASGRKSHKEIVFNDAESKDDEEDKKEMKEAKMSDVDMAERERIVKGMKKNLAGFKARYGDRAKEVMYATATKQAMKEETVDEAVQKADIPAYLRKQQGQTPLKLSDLKRKDTISDKENLAKLRNEEAEELDEKSDQARQNKTMKNVMAASKGAQINRTLKLDPAEYGYKRAQHLNVAIGRQMMKAEEVELEEAEEITKGYMEYEQDYHKRQAEYHQKQGKPERVKYHMEKFKDAKDAAERYKKKFGEAVEPIDEISLDTMKSAKEKLGNRAFQAHMDDNKYAAQHYAGRAMDMKKRIAQKERQVTKEEAKKDDVPFDGPYTKTKPAKNSDGTAQSPMSRARALAKDAMKKQMKEDIDRLFEKDDSEYNYEGEMAVTQLKTIIRHAEALQAKMQPDTNLPEWVQSKITLATDYIQTASDYLHSELEEQAPVAPVPDKKYIKGTPEHKAYKATKKPINGMPTNVKETFDADGNIINNKVSYKEFAMMLEYEAKDGRYVHKGSYGGNYVDPEGADDADDKKPKQQPADKRGRGRPAGAKSGARKITGTSKLFK
jgi:hypothetical protein